MRQLYTYVYSDTCMWNRYIQTLERHCQSTHFARIQASFSTSCTITPIPSNISCSGALHMKALVVTILFFSSTWASFTCLQMCLQPSWEIASAVSGTSGYLKAKDSDSMPQSCLFIPISTFSWTIWQTVKDNCI